jgi:hypothetical protein
LMKLKGTLQYLNSSTFELRKFASYKNNNIQDHTALEKAY